MASPTSREPNRKGGPGPKPAAPILPYADDPPLAPGTELISYRVVPPGALDRANWSDGGDAGRARVRDDRQLVQVRARHLVTAGDTRLSVVAAEVSERASSIRVLRHKLVERGNPRLVLVTSARDGEGKSTLALNLAAAMAESGRDRVLLIEADVRRPSLTNILGASPPLCFLQQLSAWRDDPSRPWSVMEVLPSGFHLLPIDPELTGAHHPRTLHGPTFCAAVAELRRVYERVVIDAPSVLTSADVNLIEDSVDGIVFVARAHRTRGRVLRRAIEQVSPAKVAGVVLVDV